VEQAWQSFERDVAAALGGRRYPRDVLAFESAPDVLVPDVGLIVDAKLRKRWTHHTLLADVRRKYCRPAERPLLVTRRSGKPGALVCCEMDFFVELLAAWRCQNESGPHGDDGPARPEAETALSIGQGSNE